MVTINLEGTMTLSERLRPFENRYYILLEQDLTSKNGFFRWNDFKHAPNNGEPTTAPDWDPNPLINRGSGLYVVKAHPLFSHGFVNIRTTPRYFEVTTDPNPPIELSGGGKFRARTITRIREITNSEPEFNPDLLADLAKNADHWRVRIEAVEKLDARVHSDLLADLAKNAGYYDVRLTAKRKMMGVKLNF